MKKSVTLPVSKKGRVVFIWAEGLSQEQTGALREQVDEALRAKPEEYYTIITNFPVHSTVVEVIPGDHVKVENPKRVS